MLMIPHMTFPPIVQRRKLTGRNIREQPVIRDKISRYVPPCVDLYAKTVPDLIKP